MVREGETSAGSGLTKGTLFDTRGTSQNKHIFPASRWEVFDPQKDYGKYRIKDKNKDAEAGP